MDILSFYLKIRNIPGLLKIPYIDRVRESSSFVQDDILIRILCSIDPFVPTDFFPAVYGEHIPTQRSHNKLKCHFSCSLKSKFLLLGCVLAGNHTEIL